MNIQTSFEANIVVLKIKCTVFLCVLQKPWCCGVDGLPLCFIVLVVTMKLFSCMEKEQPKSDGHRSQNKC